jgi:hypothetical protein
VLYVKRSFILLVFTTRYKTISTNLASKCLNAFWHPSWEGQLPTSLILHIHIKLILKHTTLLCHVGIILTSINK